MALESGRDLQPPLRPMLARTPERWPEEYADPRTAAELKWDGFRCLAFRGRRRTLLRSRHDRPLDRYFPEVVEAVSALLPPGTVVDGELILWHDGRADFDLLRQRIHPAERRVAELSVRYPARLVMFDLPQFRGEDLRRAPYSERSAALRTLEADLTPTLAITPATTDQELARSWWDTYVAADVGVEGLVLKPIRGRYREGGREWIKLRRRITAEAVVEGVIGDPRAPTALTLSRWSGARLRFAGVTAPLGAAARAEIGAAVRASELGRGRFRMFGDPSGTFRSYLRVDPELIAEVEADPLLERGRWRHPVRYVRTRPELRPEDLR